MNLCFMRFPNLNCHSSDYGVFYFLIYSVGPIGIPPDPKFLLSYPLSANK